MIFSTFYHELVCHVEHFSCISNTANKTNTYDEIKVCYLGVLKTIEDLHGDTKLFDSYCDL